MCGVATVHRLVQTATRLLNGGEKPSVVNSHTRFLRVDGTRYYHNESRLVIFTAKRSPAIEHRRSVAIV